MRYRQGPSPAARLASSSDKGPRRSVISRRGVAAESDSVEIVSAPEKIFVAVTYDPARDYVGRSGDLRQPVIALSLGGVRRKVEALLMPDEVVVMLKLDKTARLERDRRRLTGRPRLDAPPRPGGRA